MKGLGKWAQAVRKCHVYVMTHHPHHYVTAVLLTGVMWITGHWEIAAVQTSWLYAVVENIATAAEVLPDV